MPRTTAAVDEAPLRLEVNGRRIAVWTCLPERRDALAVGRLAAGGYVTDRREILGVDVTKDGDGATVRVRLTDAAERRGRDEARHQTAHGCGLLHFLHCDPALLGGRRRPLPLPADDAFPALFESLYAAAERSRVTGGLHTTALTDGRRLRFHVEEVGRHNAADKVIGAAVLADEDAGGLGLVTTARISGEIALKAARAGLSWIASRSVPTTLAVRIAEAAGMPMVGRAAGRHRRLFGDDDAGS